MDPVGTGIATDGDKGSDHLSGQSDQHGRREAPPGGQNRRRSSWWNTVSSTAGTASPMANKAAERSWVPR